jgi:hypothetical protein
VKITSLIQKPMLVHSLFLLAYFGIGCLAAVFFGLIVGIVVFAACLLEYAFYWWLARPLC